MLIFSMIYNLNLSAVSVCLPKSLTSLKLGQYNFIFKVMMNNTTNHIFQYKGIFP